MIDAGGILDRLQKRPDLKPFISKAMQKCRQKWYSQQGYHYRYVKSKAGMPVSEAEYNDLAVYLFTHQEQNSYLIQKLYEKN